MNFPKIESFEKVLRTLTIIEPENKGGYINLRFFDAPYSGTLKNQIEEELYSENFIDLWLERSSGLSLDQIVEKLKKILKSKGHPASKEICLGVLFVFSLHPQKSIKPIEIINKIIDSITSCNISQFCITSLPYKLEWGYSLPLFKISLLDIEKFKYKCKKAKSDYYERYADKLSNKLCIEREPFEINLISIGEVRREIWDGCQNRDIILKPLSKVIWKYFGDVSNELQNNFWDLWDKSQHLIACLGGPYFKKEHIDVFFESFVSVYLNLSRQRDGFVFPSAKGCSYVDMGFAHQRIPRIRKRLEEEFNFADYRETEIHKILKIVFRFFCMGIDGISSGKINEGFLNCTIALEILFGEKNNVTQSICERVATILSKGHSEEFFLKRERMREIYDIRSKYVHQGKDISEENCLELEKYSNKIVETLLRLQKSEYSHQDKFLKKWLVNIDYLAAALRANKEISSDEFLENGII